jgi:uncharacterized protein YdaU (DUF1376 family)
MALPHMPLYPGDYLRDTCHLSAEESGAYLHLIMAQWQMGALPDDDDRLRRIARVEPRRWKKVKAVVLSFFDLVDGQWSQKRVAIERNSATAKVAVRRHAGRRSAEAKA